MTVAELAAPRAVPRAVRGALDVLPQRPAPVLGIAATAVSLAGSWIPSYWGDEATSVMAAKRSWASLLDMATNIDAVHSLYYAFLHVWVGVAGIGEFATRLPSAIAVGIAVAGTVVLGRRLWGRRVAWLAGLAALGVPELTFMGMEARSYPFAIAATVWLTVLVLRLRHRPSWWGWAGYAAGVAAATYLFVYLLLLLPLHAAMLVVLGARRRALVRGTIAGIAATAAAAPILLIAYGQRGQIAFLAETDYADAYHVLVQQWFVAPLPAAVGWMLIAASLLPVLTRRGIRRAVLARRWLASAVAAFGLTAMLLIGNLFLPLYDLRYASSAIPAVAVLMGVGAQALARTVRPQAATALGAAAVLCLLAAAAPAYLAQRTPYGKDSDFKQISHVLARVAQPGQAVVFDQSARSYQNPRLALHAYPAGFRGLEDVALTTPYQRRAGLYDSVAPVAVLPSLVADDPVVWAIENRWNGMPDVQALQAAGYSIVSTHRLQRDVIVELIAPTAEAAAAMTMQ